MTLTRLLPLSLFVIGPVLSAQVEEEVDWFKGGWYVGAGAGFTNSGARASELDADLASLGFTTTSDLDDTDHGYKIFAGYRFDGPFAIELGYADLGEVESRIQHVAPDIDAFLNAVAGVHPFSASGVTLSGSYYFVDTARVSIGAHAGAWAWQSEVDIAAATGESVDVDEDGIDPFFGLRFLFDLTDNVLLRAEYDRYGVDDEDVELLSFGVQFRFRRARPRRKIDPLVYRRDFGRPRVAGLVQSDAPMLTPK